MSYKAESLGKAAQHVNAPGTRDTVNGTVAQGKFTFLSGEACFPGGTMFVSSEITGRGYRFPNVPAQILEYSALSVRYETKTSKQGTCHAASCGVIHMVWKQESAEAILAECRE